MNIIEFIFRLIQNFVPVQTARFNQMEQDGLKWYKDLQSDELPNMPVFMKPVAGYLKEHGDQWYTGVFLAVGYIFASRWLYEFMNPNQDTEDNFND